MASQEIKAVIPALGKEAVVNYDLGDSLADAVAKFGEEVVFSGFKADATVAIQGRMRALLKKEQTQEQIAADLAGWKPGVKSAAIRGPVTVASVVDKFKAMSPEEQQAFLAALQDAAQ